MKRSPLNFAKHGPMLSISDAVTLTGVDETTIRHEIRMGHLPSYRPTARLIRMNPLDLQRWLRQHSGAVGTPHPEGLVTFAVEDLMSQPVVYRLLTLEDGVLYIGSTKNIASRLASHARTQPWWPEVQRVGIQRFKTLDKAREAEAFSIGVHWPKHNRQHPRTDWETVRVERRRLEVAS